MRIPKIMYIVPNIMGFSGEAAKKDSSRKLSKYSIVEVYSLLPVLRLRELKRATYLRYFRVVIIILVIMFPYFIGAMMTLFVGLLYALMAILAGLISSM